MKIKVIDQKGKASGEVEVCATVFGAEVSTGLIHEVATAQINNQRQGTKCTLSRSEVRGGKAKPHRQKGTGRARQGSTNAPHQIGGGVAFAPKPRDFSTKINKKKKSAAFVSAISGKLRDEELVVLKDMKLKEAKTKHVAEIIEALKFGAKKVLFVSAGKDDDFLRGVSNIPTADITTAEQLCVMDIVTYKYVVASVDAVKTIDEMYKEVVA